MLASISGSKELVASLIETWRKGQRDESGGVTALMVRRRAIVRALRCAAQSGADLNARSEMPHRAQHCGRRQTVRPCSRCCRKPPRMALKQLTARAR